VAIERLLKPVVDVRKEESVGILLMFVYSFLAMTAYNILKPSTRSLFISQLGAAQLPWVLLAAGGLIGVIMQGYSRAVALVPRRWVIPIAQAVMVALLPVFWVLFRTGSDWVAVGFYFYGLILGILLISQFWTLANDIYDARQAKRLFGFVGGGAPLGGMAGSAILFSFAPVIGTTNLLLVSAALLTICLGVVTIILRRSKPTLQGVTETGEERGVGGRQALRLLRESKHLQIISLVIGFAAIGAAVIEQQLNMAAEAFRGADNTDSITQFLGQVQFYLSLAGFVIQVWLTSRIHRFLGVGFALLILPFSLGTTAAVMLLNMALWAPALARILDTSLRYTVDKTTREILFLPLPADLKYQAKPFVDVTMDRVSKGIGALLILILISDWGFGLDWQRMSYASLALTGLWIVAARRARQGYLVAFRNSIERRDVETSEVRLNVADLQTVETLVEELGHPDEDRVLYAIDLLTSLDKSSLITPLLLHHESPRVRSRALEALGVARSEVARRWLPRVQRLLGDEDAGVRAAAMSALANMREAAVPDIVRPYLSGPDSRLACSAAMVLARTGQDEDVRAAEATLTRLAASADPGVRRDVAAAVRGDVDPRLHATLAALVHDEDAGVAEEALRSIRSLGQADSLFVPALVNLLRNRRLKAAARDVLVGYGPDVVPALAHFLHERDEAIWVRRHIPATFARIPVQASMDTLVAALAREPDGFLRFKVLSAIDRLHRDAPGLTFDRKPLEALASKEAATYLTWLSLHHNLFVRERFPEGGLLDRALHEKTRRSVNRIYLLLGILYPWQDVSAARWAIERGDAKTRSSALEYLDNLLTGTLRKRLLPVLEDTPIDEKVRRGNALLSLRHRDAEETLLRLINDEDQVVAAAAIQTAARQKVWALAPDIEHVLAHRDPRDWFVFEAASWALAEQRMPEARVRQLWNEPLPAVELAARLRTLPIFAEVSVDELFRLADAGRQVRCEPGHVLGTEGEAPASVQFLLEGTVEARAAGAAPQALEPVSALGFDQMVTGGPLPWTLRAVSRVVCLDITAGEARQLLADNTDLAAGLFRTLLAHPAFSDDRLVVHAADATRLWRARGDGLAPIDKVLTLERLGPFAGIPPDELLALATAARRVSFAAGQTLDRAGATPSIWIVLDGELSLDAEGVAAVPVRAGDVAGLLETLAGTSLGRDVTGTAPGTLLRIGHEELFEVLGERPALLRQLLARVIAPAYTPALSSTAIA
jgi:AAA family ATP:ADP antiporter